MNDIKVPCTMNDTDSGNKLPTYLVLVNGITILANVVHIISMICKMASTTVRNFDKSALA